MTRSVTPEINGLRLSFLERRLVVDYAYPGTIEVAYTGGVRLSPGKDAGTVELGRFDHAPSAWFDESRWTWNAAKTPGARSWVQNVLAAHEEQRSRSYEHDGELVLIWHRLPTPTSEQALLAAGFQPSLATWRAAASDRRRALIRALLTNEAVSPGALPREQTDDRDELKERAQHAWMRWFAVFQNTLEVGGRTYKVKGRPALRNDELLLILLHSSGTSLHVRLDVSKHPLRYPVWVDGSVTLQRDLVAWEGLPALAEQIDAVLSERLKSQRTATRPAKKRGGRSKQPLQPVRPRELEGMPPAGPTSPAWADRLVDAFNADAGPQLAFSRRRGLDTIVFVIHAEARPERVLAVVDIQDEELEDVRWLDDVTPAQQTELTERLERALAKLMPERQQSLTRAALEKLKTRALALGADPERLASGAGREEFRWLAETLLDLAEPRGTDGDDLAAWLSVRSLRAVAKHIREFSHETPLEEFLSDLWEKLEELIVLVPVERGGDALFVDDAAIFEADGGSAILLREADRDGRPREVIVRRQGDCDDNDRCRIESDELAGGERAWHLGIEWDHTFIRELYRKIHEFEQGLRTAPDRLADVREMLLWTAAMIDTPRCRGEARRVAEAAFRAAKEHYDRARRLVAQGDSAEGLAAIHDALSKIAESAAALAESCAEGQATLAGTPGDLGAVMRAPAAVLGSWQSVHAAAGSDRGRRPATKRSRGQAPPAHGRARRGLDAIATETERRVMEKERELIAAMDRLTRIYSGGRLAGTRVNVGTVVVTRVDGEPEFPSLVLPALADIASGIDVDTAVALMSLTPVVEVALAGWVDPGDGPTREGDRLLAKIEAIVAAYHRREMSEDEFEWTRDALWEEAERAGVAVELAWRMWSTAGPRVRQAPVAASLPTIPVRAMPQLRYHLELMLRRIPQDAFASVISRWVRPSYDQIEAGQGAWQNVLELPLGEHSTCKQCPFVYGSNLDCDTCRRWVLSLKKPGTPWTEERIGAALYNCNEPAVPTAAVQALAQSTQPPLTAAFFREFAANFAARLAEHPQRPEDMSQGYLDHCRQAVEWLFPQPDFPLPGHSPHTASRGVDGDILMRAVPTPSERTAARGPAASVALTRATASADRSDGPKPPALRPSAVLVATERLVATLPRPDLAPLRIITRTPQVPPGTLVILPLDRAASEPEDRYVLALHLPGGQGFMFSFGQLADPAAEDLRDPDRLCEWGELDLEAVVLAVGLGWNGVAAVLDIDPAEIDASITVGRAKERI